MSRMTSSVSARYRLISVFSPKRLYRASNAAGNSAVTAHVSLPNGRPGPFARLADLGWDDEVIVIVNGLEHVYRVREVLRVAPDDLSILRHEEYSWLTLITCQGYDEARQAYRWRVAVRAVLVEVRSR